MTDKTRTPTAFCKTHARTNFTWEPTIPPEFSFLGRNPWMFNVIILRIYILSEK